MSQLFGYLASNQYLLLFLTVAAAVWLGRQSIAGYGLGDGRLGHHHRLRAFGLGLGLRLQAGTERLHQVDLLLPVHVRGGAACRSVLRQQPGWGRAQVHAACADQLGHRPRPGRARGQAVRASARGGRRHAGGVADHVRGHRLGRRGRQLRGGRAAGRGHQGSGELDDRPVLRHHLHLGHRRHHPDHQVPAEMVGYRRQGGRQAVRGRTRRQQRRPAHVERMDARCSARLPAREQPVVRQDHRRHACTEPGVPGRQHRASRPAAWPSPGTCSFNRTTSSRWAAVAKR